MPPNASFEFLRSISVSMPSAPSRTITTVAAGTIVSSGSLSRNQASSRDACSLTEMPPQERDRRVATPRRIRRRRRARSGRRARSRAPWAHRRARTRPARSRPGRPGPRSATIISSGVGATCAAGEPGIEEHRPTVVADGDLVAPGASPGDRPTRVNHRHDSGWPRNAGAALHLGDHRDRAVRVGRRTPLARQQRVAQRPASRRAARRCTPRRCRRTAPARPPRRPGGRPRPPRAPHRRCSSSPRARCGPRSTPGSAANRSNAHAVVAGLGPDVDLAVGARRRSRRGCGGRTRARRTRPRRARRPSARRPSPSWPRTRGPSPRRGPAARRDAPAGGYSHPRRTVPSSPGNSTSARAAPAGHAGHAGTGVGSRGSIPAAV